MKPANANDAQYVETMTEAQSMVDRAEALLDKPEVDPVGAAMVWAQLSTTYALAAIARDLTEIRRGMER